jgi:hypothetical protein
VIANINEYGWHCVNAIEDDGHPPWTFTIGLYETRNHPEPIIIGRSRATSHYMLDKIATAPDEDRRYDLTCPALDLLPGIACYFIEAHAQHYHDYVGFAPLLPRQTLPALSNRLALERRPLPLGQSRPE